MSALFRARLVASHWTQDGLEYTVMAIGGCLAFGWVGAGLSGTRVYPGKWAAPSLPCGQEPPRVPPSGNPQATAAWVTGDRSGSPALRPSPREIGRAHV